MKWNSISFAATAVALACAFQAAPARASATTYTVTINGTWAAGTPTTDISVAGDPFSVTFDVTLPPASSTTYKFTADITNFVFKLDGSVVSVTAPSYVAFLNGPTGSPSDDGGLVFSTGGSGYNAQINLYAAQLFSGTTSNPTLVSGDYTLIPGTGSTSAFVGLPGGKGDGYFSAGSIDIVTPEGGAPSLYLLLGGFACCGGIFLKSRAGLRAVLPLSRES
jgi:hypothetical protein